MTAISTESPSSRRVRILGFVMIVLGIVLIVAGAGTAGIVSAQLSNQDITVPKDTPFLGALTGGKKVLDPLTAYAQAEAISLHAQEIPVSMTGDEKYHGLSYAELGDAVDEAKEAGDTELADNLGKARTTVMNAELLRASLFTSVIAFGVCALVVAVGAIAVIIGWAVRRIVAA